tara:strand:- start:319 stop:582 length:264 start_codon:yes stop_codon:yes gene_type:complete
MIIPIKCFTCGNVLADKYRYYQQKVLELKIEEEGGLEETDMENVNKVKYLTTSTLSKVKTPEAKVMDSLNLNKMCCRRHMLTHVDIE